LSHSITVEREETKELAVVGKNIPFIDAREMARGRTVYASDTSLPGTLEGGLLWSPHPHAKIINIDISSAEQLPGVKAIITRKNVPNVKFGSTIQDDTVLAVDKVRHFGEPVAGVAALDEDIVEEALSLIRVEYEEIPAVFDAEEALKSTAPQVHDTAPNNTAQHFVIDRGDIQEGFRKSDLIVENVYTTQAQNPAYMEPITALANYESAMLTVWISTQDPFGIRSRFAQALGMPEARIRIHQSYMGGGFGCKIEGPDKCGLAASLLSMKSGRPVRISLKRTEELSSSRTRHPMKIYLKMGARRDGTLLAKEAKIIANTGAYASRGPAILPTTATRSDCVYRYKYLRNDAYLVYTNAIPASAFRGFGNPQSHFAAETMIDEIAEKLDMDPAELRLKNATRRGDVTIHGWQIQSCGLTECIQKATQAASWNTKRILHESADKAKRRGIGIACAVHVSSIRMGNIFPGNDSATAYVLINRDGTASVTTGQADIGSGQNTIYAMIAAEVLGLNVNDVSVLRVDTLISPTTRPTAASRGTVVSGKAVRLAAEDARRQLFEVASESMKVSPSELVLANKKVSVKDQPEKNIPLGDVANLATERKGQLLGVATYDPPTVVRSVAKENYGYGHASPNYPFAAHVAEVEVDMQTGQVKLLNYVAAHDIGKALNPMGVEGQIEGGVVQGVGYALMEQVLLKDGRVVNPHFLDYKIPSTKDIPTIKAIMVETNDPEGPFGAKSVGELVLVPVAPAIANAIRNATGLKMNSLPMTPEAVYTAILSQKKQPNKFEIL
jgi:CO/xanthine dehydrogenase Mo-binding subunit